MGAVLGLGASLWKDGAAIKAGGFLQGYTPLVASVVVQVTFLSRSLSRSLSLSSLALSSHAS
jgi:hypothetical protein